MSENQYPTNASSMNIHHLCWANGIFKYTYEHIPAFGSATHDWWWCTYVHQTIALPHPPPRWWLDSSRWAYAHVTCPEAGLAAHPRRSSSEVSARDSKLQFCSKALEMRLREKDQKHVIWPSKTTHPSIPYMYYIVLPAQLQTALQRCKLTNLPDWIAWRM